MAPGAREGIDLRQKGSFSAAGSILELMAKARMITTATASRVLIILVHKGGVTLAMIVPWATAF